MIGSDESLEMRAASRKSPFSSAAKTFSSVCGSRFRLSRHHQNVRSPTTATATMAVMRIGHMIGPPASKYLTNTFARISRNLSLSSVHSSRRGNEADSLCACLQRNPPRYLGGYYFRRAYAAGEMLSRDSPSLQIKLKWHVKVARLPWQPAPMCFHPLLRKAVQHVMPRTIFDIHLGGNPVLVHHDVEHDRALQTLLHGLTRITGRPGKCAALALSGDKSLWLRRRGFRHHRRRGRPVH